MGLGSRELETVEDMETSESGSRTMAPSQVRKGGAQLELEEWDAGSARTSFSRGRRTGRKGVGYWPCQKMKDHSNDGLASKSRA